ncbi:hypothetical protein [uncultured Cellulomonas sp.]|uniref:hypothetical protein n=1 Tax=uncultured Cellulomonas sp. TaxID=189682 RepID=UPI00261158D3|nr:hypothetical protein [uncultured Cellulomonas sp.]
MASRTDDRLAAGTGIAATLVVGVAGLVGVWTGGSGADLPGVWWTAYVVFVAAFLADSDLAPGAATGARPAWLRSQVLVAVEVVAALVVWFADPYGGFSAVLFVVNAASAAFALSRSATAAVVALQTLAVAVGTAVQGRPPPTSCCPR